MLRTMSCFCPQEFFGSAKFRFSLMASTYLCMISHHGRVVQGVGVLFFGKEAGVNWETGGGYLLNSMSPVAPTIDQSYSFSPSKNWTVS